MSPLGKSVTDALKTEALRVLAELRLTLMDMGPTIGARGEILSDAGRQLLFSVLEGKIDADEARDRFRKLAEAAKSEVLVAGYTAEAKTVEVLSSSFGGVLRIAAAFML